MSTRALAVELDLIANRGTDPAAQLEHRVAESLRREAKP